MNIPEILLWGFLATLLLTTVMSLAQGLGLSRMSVPLLLGTMITPDHDRAPLVGYGFHLLLGWIFAVPYVLVFHRVGVSSAWLGAGLGLFHALLILAVALPALPGLHPRMASDRHGPEPTAALEPPGFLALNYGYRTPLIAAAAHALYGLILGWGYRVV